MRDFDHDQQRFVTYLETVSRLGVVTVGSPNLIRYVIFVCVHFITYKNKANLVAALAMIFNFLIPMDPDNSALKSAGLVNAAPRIPGREHHSL
jgi:hypothetical protein